MNSDIGGTNGNHSRRVVLRMASGAGLALIAGVASGGGSIERAMAQAGDTELVCIQDGVRIRKNPDLSGAIIGSLRQGAVVNLIDQPVERDGYTWFSISLRADRAITGWAAANFFIGNEGGYAVGTNVVTTASVRLRRRAGLGGAVIRSVAKGTHAVIRSVGIPSDGYTWFGVTLDDGTQGFIAGAFLAHARVEPTGQRLRVVNGPLRLRREPGFAGAVLTTLPTGATLFIADATTVTRDRYLWRYAQVEAKPGVFGYVADVFTVPID